MHLYIVQYVHDRIINRDKKQEGRTVTAEHRKFCSTLASSSNDTIAIGNCF